VLTQRSIWCRKFVVEAVTWDGGPQSADGGQGTAKFGSRRSERSRIVVFSWGLLDGGVGIER